MSDIIRIGIESVKCSSRLVDDFTTEMALVSGSFEDATPALAFSITQGFAERPLRHYELEMRAAHRHTPSRSTLERIGKRVGEAIQAMVVDVEPTIRDA